MRTERARMREERPSTLAVVRNRRTSVVLLLLVVVGPFLALGCGSRVDTANGPSSPTSTVVTTTSSGGSTAEGSATGTTALTSTTTASSAITPTTRTSVTRSVPPETKRFCDYIASVSLNDIPDTDWAAGYRRIQEALVEAKDLAPAPIKQAVTDLSGAVDSLKPEVEAKRVTSSADLDVWFAKQDSATQTKVSTAGKQIQIFYEGNCTR